MTRVNVAVPKPVTCPPLVTSPAVKKPLDAVMVTVVRAGGVKRGMLSRLAVTVTCWPTPAVGVDTVKVFSVASAG